MECFVGDITYRQWTTAFTEGSFYEGTLEENNIIKFLDPKTTGCTAGSKK
jgi:hypothetical protein